MNPIRVQPPGILLPLVIALVPGSTALAQQQLTVLRGADTIAVERYTPHADRLEGELLFGLAGIRASYLIRHPNARVTEVEYEVRRVGVSDTAPPTQRIVAVFQSDSVELQTTGGDGAVTTRRFAATPDLTPFVNPSFAMVELGLRLAVARGKPPAGIALFLLGSGQTLPVPVIKGALDSLILTLGGVELRLETTPDGAIRGGGVPAQGLTLLKSTPAAGTTLDAGAPDYGPPEGAPYRADDVTVPTPYGHTLGGTLTLPSGKGPFAAVVTATGSGLQDRDGRLAIVPGYRPFYQIADALGREGIAVLRLDDRGFGASGGDGVSATTRDFADDVRAAIAFLRRHSAIDPARIALIGHSEGALIAPMVASDDSTLAGIVLLAGPAATGREIIEYQNREVIGTLTTMSAQSRDSMLHVAMGRVDSLAGVQPWLRFFLDYDPLPTAARVTTPTLILHGATDRQVPPEQRLDLEKAFRSMGNPDVTVVLVPETNHLFLHDTLGAPQGYSGLVERSIRPAVLNQISSWLQIHLRGK